MYVLFNNVSMHHLPLLTTGPPVHRLAVAGDKIAAYAVRILFVHIPCTPPPLGAGGSRLQAVR